MATAEASLSDTTSQVTVFTGFLGAGKTTLILSVLKQLPKDYRVVVLKNEFGDAETDSALMRESSIEVKEMINGCLCCVLVGQMKNALQELKEAYQPHRIIVETSGSAFPAPIAWQIRELTDEGFRLDSIVTVVDCANFTGYEDTSYTAKMQAQYTDLILLNKHQLVNERQLDTVIDRINDLNTDTPKVKCGSDSDAPISLDLLFGLDTKLFQLQSGDESSARAAALLDAHKNHHQEEVDRIKITTTCDLHPTAYDVVSLVAFLTALSREDIYRIKGVIRLAGPGQAATRKLSAPLVDAVQSLTPNDAALFILNYSFGRYTLTPLTHNATAHQHAKTMAYLTVMGQDLALYRTRFRDGFGVTDDSQFQWYPKGHMH
ncbi:hypothetical protein H4R34_002244 [Dimargaris verticillata]|uniref:CobW/HypB/UreG nucleotide-binding domain-containing protein n=1 Tax=Dimargaris verticillata TaxID=2761393 RepID=A0A9W8B8G0_9FUNG|nr:hypothetical protein H4R34_002244 [Dimargaris verticillata]